MKLTEINLQHFRHFSQREIRFDPHLNIIVGSNGSGKTSILEAVYFLAHARSFRSSQLNRLIQQEAHQFNLLGRFESSHSKLILGVSRNLQGEAQARLNGVNLTSHLEVTKQLPVILFNPEHFSLLMSSAKARRQLLDWGLFYHQPEFFAAWQTLRKALKQRNAALKQKAATQLVRLWDPILIKAATELDCYRAQYVDILFEVLQRIAGVFLQQHQIELSYYRGWGKDQTLAEALEQHLEQDRKIGHTQYGPQRADLRVKVNGLPASEVLSRGQQKLLICSLKIAQGILLQTHTQYSPIFLLDDIVSEFDQTHLQRIFEQLLPLNAQLLISVINPALLPTAVQQTKQAQIQL